MASSILDRYGIKEVADVMFYEINDNGTKGKPVLYLDTLKVSTIEQTAENVSARGGKGNPELIVWDYNKEITVTLEDALFSMKSMSIMFGDNNGVAENTAYSVDKTIVFTYTDASSIPTVWDDPSGTSHAITGASYFDAVGSAVETSAMQSDAKYFCVFSLEGTSQEVEISASTFPGTYYITGDTYARSDTTGKDEFFQFIIPKAKVTSEVTLTMEAEGDPSTFSMNLKVLRPSDGVMLKLVKYSLNA